MFYLYKDGKIHGSSSNNLKQEGFDTITKETSNEEQLEAIERVELGDEKQALISQYKAKQKEIQETKAEIQEIDDSFDSRDESGKALATARKKVLEARLGTMRTDSDTIAEEGIQKFGNDIIGEF